MLDEIAVRKLKLIISKEIEGYNIEISKLQKQIDDYKKRIWIGQAKLSEIDKILEEE
ncbi:MAG: hypothetical protein PHZ02_01540 [Desulfocapsaceae bacterium]|nr:hypothetical protein [Desulfocapsaceae bacterium]